MPRKGPKPGFATHHALRNERGQVVIASMGDAARRLGCHPTTIFRRLEKGMPRIEAYTTPVKKRR